MEVIVHSTLSSVQGHVIVATDPSHTVDSLITAFCVEKGIPQRKEYVLRTSDEEELANVKRLSACEVANGDTLYLGIRESSAVWCCGCSQWWLLAAVALLIGTVGIVAISVLKASEAKIVFDYGVVLDAGSSHTQVYVYKWPGGKDNGTGIVSQLYTNHSKPGISSYTSTPEKAGTSVSALLDQAAAVVPSRDQSTTPVYLGATAGMRLLRLSDNKTCQAILNSVRDVIATSKFSLSSGDVSKSARILAGMEEGAFSWVTVNYLSGAFGLLPPAPLTLELASNPGPTSGALDLGGASTQNSFTPADPSQLPAAEKDTLVMYGQTYEVYTHSYLCYGLNEAYRQYRAELVRSQNFNSTITDPCRPEGNETSIEYAEIFEVPCTMSRSPGEKPKNQTYRFVGSSDNTECLASVHEIFNWSVPCPREPCTFDGVHQPPLHGHFMAFSGYYYVMDFLNLTAKGNFSLNEFENRRDALCNKTWQQVSQIPPQRVDVRDVACFESHYVHTLLVEAYGFNTSNWNTLEFVKQSSGADLGWSVGFMLNSSNSIPASYPQPAMSDLVFSLLIVLFCVFIALAAAFVYHAKTAAHKQQQYQKLATYGSI